MIILAIIYLVLYLIVCYIGYGAIYDGYNDYPDYSKDNKPGFWSHVIIFNPLNVLIGIGFMIWCIYDLQKELKKDKKIPKKEKEIEYNDILAGMESLRYMMDHPDEMRNVDFINTKHPYSITEAGTRLLIACGGKDYIDDNKDELLNHDVEKLYLKLIGDSKHKRNNFEVINNYVLNNRTFEGQLFGIFTVVDLMTIYFKENYKQ